MDECAHTAPYVHTMHRQMAARSPPWSQRGQVKYLSRGLATCLQLGAQVTGQLIDNQDGLLLSTSYQVLVQVGWGGGAQGLLAAATAPAAAAHVYPALVPQPVVRGCASRKPTQHRTQAM